VNTIVRQLVESDAAQYLELRREALVHEPYAFGSSPGHDRFRSVEDVRHIFVDREQAVFGAFDSHLVGALGVRRLTRPKLHHRAEVWGMYVRESHRRSGLGRRLLEAAIQFARERDGVRQLHLTVTERAVAAAALYESLGFVVWGIEPAGLRIDGVDVAELHMVLQFENST
jgi:ribosomal protein S18 acetylase RimI-like enzyme